jgi:hypothetical protein
MNSLSKSSLPRHEPVAVPPQRSVIQAALVRSGQWFWRAMEAHGQARARRELLQLADRYEKYQPDLARELRAASRHSDNS